MSEFDWRPQDRNYQHPGQLPAGQEASAFGSSANDLSAASAQAPASQPAPEQEAAAPEAAPTYATPTDISMEAALLAAQRSDSPVNAAQPADGVRNFSDLNLPQADATSVPTERQEPLSPPASPLEEPQQPGLTQPAADTAGLVGHSPASEYSHAKHRRKENLAQPETPESALQNMLKVLDSTAANEVNGYTLVQAAGLVALVEGAQNKDPGALAQLAAGGSELIAQVAHGFTDREVLNTLAESSYALTKAGVISPINGGVAIQQQATPRQPATQEQINESAQWSNKLAETGTRTGQYL